MPSASIIIPSVMGLELIDFDTLKTRYLALPFAPRAQAMLDDTQAALSTADNLLAQLEINANIVNAFERVRKNPVLAGKMRVSEAKSALYENSGDFLQLARHKLASWRKTMERIGAGEGIVQVGGREVIPDQSPIACALLGLENIGYYLSIIQLAVAELAKIDVDNASSYMSSGIKLRRCATIICDCKLAAEFDVAK